MARWTAEGDDDLSDVSAGLFAWHRALQKQLLGNVSRRRWPAEKGKLGFLLRLVDSEGHWLYLIVLHSPEGIPSKAKVKEWELMCFIIWMKRYEMERIYCGTAGREARQWSHSLHTDSVVATLYIYSMIPVWGILLSKVWNLWICFTHLAPCRTWFLGMPWSCWPLWGLPKMWSQVPLCSGSTDFGWDIAAWFQWKWWKTTTFE